MMSIETMLPLLRCPRSHEPLSRQGDLLVSAAGHSYPIVAGKPVLVRDIRPMHVTPPPQSIVSRNIAEFQVGPEYPEPDLVVLHLGAGDVACADPRVISMDVLPTANSDLVAEAEALPFRDGSLGRVVSGAVFEHLYDPLCAMREVRRVLRDEGTFYIDTAFMQGYHGFPSHYFNMTPQAAETFLVDDFVLVDSRVPGSGTPLETIVAVWHRFLEGLPVAERKELLDLRLGEVLERLGRDRTRKNPLLREVSDYVFRCIGASVLVQGRKPRGYEAGVQRIAGELGDLGWQTLKREYYALRMAVIERHHEVQLYRRLATEAGRPPDPDDASVPILKARLESAQVADPLDLASWSAARHGLEQLEAELKGMRDGWIQAFADAQQKALAAVARPEVDGPQAEQCASDAEATAPSPRGGLKGWVGRVLGRGDASG